MIFANKFEKIFKALLPSPFTIAIILTLLSFLLALFLTDKSGLQIMQYWEKGIWNNSLLVFAFQMMLMLVLGHTLALTQPINKLIHKVTRYCNNTSNAAAIITFLTLLVSLFNWGLGLIFGAIFARKVGE